MLRRIAKRLLRPRTLPIASLTLALAAGGLAFAPTVAEAFCGFYVSGADSNLFNNATMVVMMREGTRTVLSMRNNYQGPPENFAMVVPVPVVLQKENVKTLGDEVFTHVDSLSAPRLVEYWEQDPCAPQIEYSLRGMKMPRLKKAKAESAGSGGGLGVTIEAQFKVGEYEVVVLSAKDSSGLDTWLRQEKYNIPPGAEPLLRPYVEEGMKFFVAKVDVKKVKFDAKGQAQLSPLRFHYDTPEFRLPVRLGLINSAGTQDLLVHILARGKRYELANRPNVTIPTNLDVDETARGRFGELYAALFDATVARTKGAAVTEYSWDSGSCDPCPTPPLNPNELTLLGTDVLDAASASGAALGSTGRAPSRAKRRRPSWGGMVLTRIHLRYDKDGLGDDLVFREAEAIVGGREFSMGGEIEKGSRPAGVNNFQARYAIRHPWKGQIACADPQRGIWGGPPSNPNGKPTATPATDLAFAPRGKVQLARMIKEPVPELGLMTADLVPAGGKVEGLEPPSSDGAADKSAAGQGADKGADKGAAGQGAAEPGSDKGSASEIARKSGCTIDSEGGGAGGVLLLAALVGWRRRRRSL